MMIEAMLDAVVRREGAFSHLAADKGGATKFGVTQTSLSSWRGRAVSAAEVATLSIDEAKDIYRARYYLEPRISQLPDPLDDLLFDFGVNSGPPLAVMALQEVLGVQADGRIGPLTLAAVLAADLHDLMNGVTRWRLMMAARICKKDPSQLIFLSGWIARYSSFMV